MAQKLAENSDGTKLQQQPNTSNAEINLEKVLLIEDKIWTLLEVHRFLERVVKENEAKKGFEEEQKEAPVASTLEEALTKEEFASKLSEVAFLCEEWWEVTHEDSINNLEKAFRHDQLRRAVR